MARDAQDTIGQTLESILAQYPTPSMVIVVDDGSTDRTPRILRKFVQSTSGQVLLVRKEKTPYDIRRVPSNINEARRFVKQRKLRFRYVLISGDDCQYPPDYVSAITQRMESNRKLVVASGVWGDADRVLHFERVPVGSGRLVSEDFWNSLGGEYPEAYGWEAWLIFKALSLGYTVRAFEDMKFRHLRAGGSVHGYAHWGLGMRALGYHPIYVVARAIRHLISLNRRDWNLASTLLRSYFFADGAHGDPFFIKYDEELQSFVTGYQARRILSTILRTKVGRD